MKHSTPQAGHRRAGFTLVEVLMVVAIIAIAGAIVVPSMIRAGTLQIQGAARMVIADVLVAQNEAVARAESVRLVFEPDVNRYYLADSTGAMIAATWRTGGSSDDNYVVDLSADQRFDGVRIDSATFGEGSTLEFDDLGAPVDGGTIDLVAGNVRYRVTVAEFTGRVSVQEVD